MKNRTEGEMIKVYQKIINKMKAAGLGLKKQVLNNKCLATMKACIKGNNMDYKLTCSPGTTQAKPGRAGHSNTQSPLHLHPGRRQGRIPPIALVPPT